MKDFIAIFLAFFIIFTLAALLFSSFFSDSVWGMIASAAFVLALLGTALMKQQIRIESLKKKVETLLQENENE